MRAVLCVVSIWMLLAGMVQGEESSPLRTMMNGNDSRGWEAVGRIDIGGVAFCTGALIAPDLVLTAAHCLFGADGGTMHRTRDIKFLAGWRNGRANAYRGVRRAIPHPKFEYTGGDRISRVAYDVALLQLDHPISKPSVTPFQTGTRPRKGAEVGVVSYAHDRSESPAIQEVCHVLARRSGTLLLSCDVDFGSSGAPIFSMNDEGHPSIVSVVSAKADVDERTVSLGTSLEKPLAELMKIYNAGDSFTSSDAVRRPLINLGTPAGDSGAKFLRP